MRKNFELIDLYINYLIVEKGLADATIESYSGDLKKIISFLTSCQIKKIEKADTTVILKYLIFLRDEDLSPRSRARHLVTLRGFFKFLINEKYLKKDPTRIVDLPKTGIKLPDVLSIEEIICIDEVLNKRSANWRGFHVFKEYKTEIYVGWEDESRSIIVFRVGDYQKKLRYPNTKFLALLLDHILEEKIEFATSSTYKTKDRVSRDNEYSLFSENITVK